MAISSSASTRPLGVHEIVSQAKSFEFSTSRPLQSWLRSAKMLLTEAAMSEDDGDLQTAYLYLYRHAELILSSLPQHPDYDKAKYKLELSAAKRAVRKNLAKLEQLKPKVTEQYQRYVDAVKRRDAEKDRIEDEQDDFSPLGYSESGRLIHANENRQLAVDLAHEEIQRRDATRQTSRQAGISPGTVASRRRGLVEPIDGYAEDVDSASSSIQNIGRRLNDPSNQVGERQSHRSSLQASGQNAISTTYNYPSVPRKEGHMEWDMPALSRDLSAIAPLRPAKQNLPNLEVEPAPQAPAIPPKSESPFSPTRQQSKYVFKPSAFTEAGAPLRTVMLPPELRTTFLNHAHANTARNLETCAILCGTLIHNALFINHLIIPDQTSTSDTCDTTEEGDNALFDYCDNADLLVCGWIHTHPTQSCFLSSRDLHTSSGYQVMLPEAIAIVCAPRQNPDWGVFRLTDPPGLPAVLNCHEKGLFHPHNEAHLYTDALRPGHVVEGPGLKFEVVDLRKKQ